MPPTDAALTIKDSNERVDFIRVINNTRQLDAQNKEKAGAVG